MKHRAVRYIAIRQGHLPDDVMLSLGNGCSCCGPKEEWEPLIEQHWTVDQENSEPRDIRPAGDVEVEQIRGVVGSVDPDTAGAWPITVCFFTERVTDFEPVETVGVWVASPAKQ